MKCFARSPRADLAIFHEFAPPPTGGGHQFMRALCAAFEQKGLRLELNTLSRGTRACLLNSYNFNFAKLQRACRKFPDVRRVHRIDGPLQTYRGFDDGTDQRIIDINRALAHATICQSRFSLEKHLELGFTLANPVLIANTPDPSIFHNRGRVPFDPSRKLRLVSVSWSDNPNKGLDTYRWLDEHLDFTRIEYTFVGRIQTTFRNIHLCEPMASEPLAALLRTQDITLTASRNDPCSNSLIEALACGLPALYLDSGGHAELVGPAGLPFQSPEQIPTRLDTLAARHADFQSAIRVPALDEIAQQYLAILLG